MVGVGELFVGAFADALSLPAEDAAWAEVDDAAAEDVAGVSGKAGRLSWVVVLFEPDEQEHELADDVLVLFVGDVHAPVAEGVVEEPLAERAGVADRLAVGLEDVSVVAASCPDEDRLGVEAGTHPLFGVIVTAVVGSVKGGRGGIWAGR